MSKFLYILDPGHGGMIDGKNQSKDGKYSPKFPDGTRFYEGVNNRDNVSRILSHLESLGVDCVDITGGSQLDIPLQRRVSRANEFAKTKPCIYISVHSDAVGNGEEWHPASGISVYTSKGQTKSDIFASLMIDSFEEQYSSSVKWRQDNADGDKDKEENFYVLRETSMPAILIEGGFHTNEQEVKRMMTDEWKSKFVNAVTNAILKWEKLNK